MHKRFWPRAIATLAVVFALAAGTSATPAVAAPKTAAPTVHSPVPIHPEDWWW
jgi:hypothetical protein